MNKNATNTFAQMGKTPPSSAGYPMPPNGEPLPSGLCAPPPSACCKTRSDESDSVEEKNADGLDAILAEARRAARKEERRAALQSVRRGSVDLGGYFPGKTLEALFGLVESFIDIVPFSDERLSSQSETDTVRLCPEEWGDSGKGELFADLAAELDPMKWGARGDDAAPDGAADDSDAKLDPRNWSSEAEPQPREDRAGDCSTLLNPTVIAARYEKEAEAAREGGWHHALNDLPIDRYNKVIRASNDVSLLWEKKPQASAYDLVKSLVLRTVISDDELAGRVLAKCACYLYDIKRQAAPMIDLWHEEAGLEPPVKRY